MRPMTDASPWWAPHVHADRRPRLLLRNAIAAAIRDWFARRDFVEVRDRGAAGLARQRDASVRLRHRGDRARRRAPRRSICTPRRNSPARSCSRPARQRIFSFGPVYRNRERGPLHHPEFTMLEWYRAGETYDEPDARIAPRCSRWPPSGPARERFAFRGREADPFAEPERLTVADAFLRHAGIDLLATVAADGGTDRDALHAAVAEAGLRTAPDDSWTDLFSRVMVERVEPMLGIGRATILYEYPISEAALARPSAARSAGSPNASSSIAAASSSPTPSAN